MKKWLLPSLGFLALYLVFIIAFAPASWFAAQAPLSKNVQLGAVEGSLWHSKVDSVQVDGIVLNDVDAKLSVLSLLTLNPSVDLSFGNPLLVGPAGELSASGFLGDLMVEDADVNLPANLIAQLAQLPVPATAHKNVEVKLQVFEQGAPICSQAQGTITWKQAAVTTFDKRVELGDLSAKLSCQKGELQVVIDQDNKLGLSLTAAVGARFKTKVNGYVKPTNETPQEVIQALSFWGKPDREGRYAIRL